MGMKNQRQGSLVTAELAGLITVNRRDSMDRKLFILMAMEKSERILNHSAVRS